MEWIPEMTTKVSPLHRPTGVEDPGRVDGDGTGRPDPEVPERARRRTFTAQYKLDIVSEYDAAPDGEKGAVLRREGLYSSHVIEWRRARDAWRESGLGAPADIDALSQKITHLEQHVTDLRLQLERADDDLQAARAANRELMTQLNASPAAPRR